MLHRFCKNHSTDTCLLYVKDKILKDFYFNILTGAMLIDLKKDYTKGLYHPQPPTTTHNYPQSSTITYNHPHLSKITHNQTQPSATTQKTTHNHPQPPTTIQNYPKIHPRPSTTIRNHPKITQKSQNLSKTVMLLHFRCSYWNRHWFLIMIRNNGIYTCACVWMFILYR